MGKRKSSKPAPKDKVAKLAVVFDCPFCNHEKSIECKIKRAQEKGSLFCRVCGVTWDMPINDLTEPIDIFNAWIDECEREKEEDEYEDGGHEGSEEEAPY